MRPLLLVLTAALLAAGCADDADPTTTSSVVPLPAAPTASVETAPGAEAVDPALAAFWSGFQTAVATGRDEAVLAHLHFPLVVNGEAVARGGYASSLAAGLWGDEDVAAAIEALTPADFEPDGEAVRFTAQTETVVEGEMVESAVVGWIGRTPAGAWKVTRIDLAG